MKEEKGKEKATTESTVESETELEPAVSAATESTMEDVERFSTTTPSMPTLDFFRDGDKILKRFSLIPKLEGRGVDSAGPQQQSCTPKFQMTLLNGLAEILSYYYLPAKKFGPKDRHILLTISVSTIRQTKRLKNCDTIWVNPAHQKVFCDAAMPIYYKLCKMALAWSRSSHPYPPQDMLKQKTWAQYFAPKEPRSQSIPYVQTLPKGAIAIRDQWLATLDVVMRKSTDIKDGDSESTREWKEKRRNEYYDHLPDFNGGYEGTSLQGTKVKEVESIDDVESKGSSSVGSLYHLNKLANKYNPGLEDLNMGPEEGYEDRAIDMVIWPKAAVSGDDDLGGFKMGEAE
ncbi:uncharacterized protein BDZ99DRAFT_467446 [Mytilinidion resinicola]|uniref:Uncharacterized protein n=1 Tax=Mytilinidion resinicola TaxID=574789 RepID=A0A6A6Y6G6_9PEZI|nr:uncharacterized protein BDZ99DRAFT_467446 [Mytilinidion resinicola]KAF2804392.1 hypothetical protein BDZ99DRAFT_467446 [Mytilinidion resinicola]